MTDSPEPARTGHRWVDLVVAVTALSISGLSIYVAQSTNQRMERVMRASAWPFAQLGSGNVGDDGEHAIAFGIDNVGTGPARIYSCEMQVDGQPVPQGGHMLTNVLHACCDAEFSAAVERADGGMVAVYGSEVSAPVSRRFLAPNAEVTAIRWPRNDANSTVWHALDMARQQGRITMSVCYCSVFDECWVARTGTFPPDEIDSCPIPEATPMKPGP